MTDRHPPQEELVTRFLSVNSALVWPSAVASIVEEMRATKCEHIRTQDALLVLTFERWERGILNKTERDILVSRIYE